MERVQERGLRAVFCDWNAKGRTIRKVMGGVGKKTKKDSCKGKCQEKKFVQRRRSKTKFMQKEGATPGPAILISVINKDI